MIVIKYLYKASNKAGQTVEGLIEAADKKAVLSTLRSKSLYLLDLKEANPRSAMEITFGSAKIPKKDLAIFCTQFSSILKSGVPLIQALSIMDEQMENKKLKKIVQTVYEDLQRGKGLSEAFSQHEGVLPMIMIKMIEAGELSGTLDLSLERLSIQFEKENAMAKKVQSAMMYPIIVCVVAILVVVFLLVAVVPQFMGFFEGTDTELPAITSLMLSISDAIQNGWMYIIAVLVFLFIGFRYYKSTDHGRLQIDTLKIRIPVIRKSMVRILSARFCRTLATLTSTGVSLTQSLRIASQVVSNKLAENKIVEIEEQIKEGRSLHMAIVNAELFPSMLMHMAKIGEESGTLDAMLEKASVYFEDEADSAITKMTSLLQPILLIIVAVIIVGIMLSILLPIFSIYGSI